MRDQNIDSRGEQVREVYAYFGLAIYLAQCLEHCIVNGLLWAKLMPKEIKAHKRRGANSFKRAEWEARFDLFVDKQFEQTR